MCSYDPQPVVSGFRRFVSPRLIGCFLLAIAVFSAAAVCARAADGPSIIPLDQIKPGMAGVGYTIFAGDKIEKFDLEVLGILPNLIGPRQSIILVQLHGEHVEHTGVVASPSGYEFGSAW